jgi:hypothetical protein
VCIWVPFVFRSCTPQVMSNWPTLDTTFHVVIVRQHGSIVVVCARAHGDSDVSFQLSRLTRVSDPASCGLQMSSRAYVV